MLDKWFSLQAIVAKPEALSVVENLVDHPAFSITNPNKVRALIGAFSSNYLGFHREDGLGYQFYADRVLELNLINPQVAARMVGVFNNWQVFAEPNKSLMKHQLERIQSSDNLAKDVTEIVSKALKT